MMDVTQQNLENRKATIEAQLGHLAYQRREHEIRMEEIDKQVAAMEAQGVLIEATLSDMGADRVVEEAKQAKTLADAKEKRSKAAKKAAERKKKAGAGPDKA